MHMVDRSCVIVGIFLKYYVPQHEVARAKEEAKANKAAADKAAADLEAEKAQCEKHKSRVSEVEVELQDAILKCEVSEKKASE